MLTPTNFFKQKKQERRAEIISALIHHQAKIGGQLFGPIPEGHRREFFCLDKQTWVWHEEWKDDNGQWQTMTTRYDIRDQAVFKSQGGQSYQKLDETELRNLYQAAQLYVEKMEAERNQMFHSA